MKKYRFITPIISAILVFVLLVLTFTSLYRAPHSFSVSFLNRDGLFEGISVEFEVFDGDDEYSLHAALSAGETVSPKFDYGDRHRDHYDYNYDRYSRGESNVTVGYSFSVPSDVQKTVAEGGDSHSSITFYPDGTSETNVYHDPYYKVEKIYISRSLYTGETVYGKKIYESEPMVLEANENLEIFAGGGKNGETYEPSYIELSVNGGERTRISRTSSGYWFWSDADGNVFFLDCLEETYFKESSIHHFKKTGDGEGDYQYKKIADVSLGEKRKILEYRAYANASLIVTEDEKGVKHITTCDHTTGELHEICSFDGDTGEEVVIGYSNGVACVRFSSQEYISYLEGTKTRTVKDIYYRAVDMTSHTLAATGDIEKLVTQSVYGALYYQNKDDIMDILWRDGRLYVIDNAAMLTSSPEDQGNIPVISVMNGGGAILMGYAFLEVNYPENGGQNIVTRFID